MILMDTGPLVALFDPRDDAHDRARSLLTTIRQPLATTVPVLTETFHLLGAGSRGTQAVEDFVGAGGLRVWFFHDASLARAFELMRRYADHPMDLADASLVVAAEELRSTTVFTLDRTDFSTYRVGVGRSMKRFRILG